MSIFGQLLFIYMHWDNLDFNFATIFEILYFKFSFVSTNIKIINAFRKNFSINKLYISIMAFSYLFYYLISIIKLDRKSKDVVKSSVIIRIEEMFTTKESKMHVIINEIYWYRLHKINSLIHIFFLLLFVRSSQYML